ncbi:hypothetical protein BLAT2472_10177 [Burkholderia latens]
MRFAHSLLTQPVDFIAKLKTEPCDITVNVSHWFGYQLKIEVDEAGR